MMNKQKFQETFSVLHASDDTVAEVLKMTSKKENKTRRWILGAAVAAVLCIVMVLTFGSVVPQPIAAPEEPREVYENADAVINALYGWDESFDPALGEKYLKPYIYPVGGSVSMEGFTLTAEAAAFDPVTGCALLYYSIENPNGFEGYWENVNKVYDANETGEYDFGPNYPKPMLNYGHGYGILDEANSTDTKQYLVALMVYNEEIWTDTEGLTKQAIEAGLGDQLEEILADARGEKIMMHLLKVGVGRTDSIVITPDPVTGMEWVTLDGGNMRLSPVGLTLIREPYEQTEGKWKGAFDIYSFNICFVDGTKCQLERAEYDENGCYTFHEWNYYLCCGYGSRNKEEYITYIFKQLVDLDQVVAIELNGVEYPVDQYE